VHESVSLDGVLEPLHQRIQVGAGRGPSVYLRGRWPNICASTRNFDVLKDGIDLVGILDRFDRVANTLSLKSDSRFNVTVSVVTNFQHVVGTLGHTAVDVLLPCDVMLEISWSDAESGSLRLVKISNQEHIVDLGAEINAAKSSI